MLAPFITVPSDRTNVRELVIPSCTERYTTPGIFTAFSVDSYIQMIYSYHIKYICVEKNDFSI